MNERIKELSDIAYKNHLAKNPHSSFGRRPDYDKEFAELIVQECMDISYEYDAPKMSGPGMIIASRIESHFGVE